MTTIPKWQKVAAFREYVHKLANKYVGYLKGEPNQSGGRDLVLEGKFLMSIKTVEKIIASPCHTAKTDKCDSLLDYLTSNNLEVPYGSYGEFGSQYSLVIQTPQPTSLPASLAKRPPVPFLIDVDFLNSEAARRFEPVDFYSVVRPAQWWGIIQELYKKPNVYETLLEKIGTRIAERAVPILALLHGSGGMGKSSMARQLVADLVKPDTYDVFWFASDYDEEDLKDLKKAVEDNYRRPTLVFVDGWNEQKPEKQKSLSDWITSQINDPRVFFVLTNRTNTPENLENKKDTLRYLHDLDSLIDDTDREALIGHSAAKSGWEGGANLPESLKRLSEKNKPLLLTFVASHLSGRHINRHEGSLESLLAEIVEDDLRQCPSKNLVVALQLYARWYSRPLSLAPRTHSLITLKSFLEIAKQFGPDKEADMTAYENLDLQETNWGKLRYYISLQESDSTYHGYGSKKEYDPSERKDSPLLLFNHDELIQQLIKVEVNSTPVSLKQLQVELLKSSSHPTSSTTLFNGVLAEMDKTLQLTEGKAWGYFKAFIKAKNGHHTWAGLITLPKPLLFERQLKDEGKTRWDYIDQCKEAIGRNSWHDNYILRFVNAQKDSDTQKALNLKPIIERHRELITNTLLACYRLLLKKTFNEKWKEECKLQLESRDAKVVGLLLSDSPNWEPAQQRALSIIKGITKANLKFQDEQLMISALLNVNGHDKDVAESFIDRVFGESLPSALQTPCLKILENSLKAQTIASRVPLLSLSLNGQERVMEILKLKLEVRQQARTYLENLAILHQPLLERCLDILRREEDCFAIALSVANRLPRNAKLVQVLRKCMDMLRYTTDAPKLAVETLSVNPIEVISDSCFRILEQNPNFHSSELEACKFQLIEQNRTTDTIKPKVQYYMLRNGWLTELSDWQKFQQAINNPIYGNWQVAYLRLTSSDSIREDYIQTFLNQHKNRVNVLKINLVPLFAYALQQFALKNLAEAEIILQRVWAIPAPKSNNRILQYRLYQTNLENSAIWENACQKLLSNYKDKNTPRDFIASCLANRSDDATQVEHIRQYYLENWRDEYKHQTNPNQSKNQDKKITKHIQVALQGCMDLDLVKSTAKAIFDDDDVWMNYPQLFRAAENVILSGGKQKINDEDLE